MIKEPPASQARKRLDQILSFLHQLPGSSRAVDWGSCGGRKEAKATNIMEGMRAKGDRCIKQNLRKAIHQSKPNRNAAEPEGMEKDNLLLHKRIEKRTKS